MPKRARGVCDISLSSEDDMAEVPAVAALCRLIFVPFACCF